MITVAHLMRALRDFDPDAQVVVEVATDDGEGIDRWGVSQDMSQIPDEKDKEKVLFILRGDGVVRL